MNRKNDSLGGKCIRFLNCFRDIDLKICIIYLAAIIVIIFLAIIFRQIGYSLGWTAELSRYFFVHLSFLGISVVVRKKANIRLTFIINRFQQKPRRVIVGVSEICIGIFCCIIVALSFIYIKKIYHIATPTLRIPTGWFYIMGPIGLGLSAIYYFMRVVSSFRGK